MALRRSHILVAGFGMVMLAGLAGCKPGSSSRVELPTPPPAPTPTPVPTPTPPPYVPNKRLEVGKIFNGVQLRTSFETEIGTTASQDRQEPGSYAVELALKVKVPKPHMDLEALSRLNPQLPNVLPKLPELLASAKVSPTFDDLYRRKVNLLQQNLLRLDALLTRHNFYDCETMLELQHPGTKRRALLIQGDMDTCTDGSDSDRVPEVDGSSVTFQPFTSYRWGKKTSTPSTFIPLREAKLKQYTQELAAGAAPARAQELKDAQARLKSEIADLKRFSFLVAAVDPYVVMPGAVWAARGKTALSPAIGDLAVVIYGDTIYPAIVGDVGPTTVVGESSLRICQEINARASSYNRPVSDLKVTYLFFPDTAEKPADAPDHDKIRARCEQLLQELGGFAGTLHTWPNVLKPPTLPATPAPVPPAASPAPTASPAPGPATSPAPNSTPAPAAAKARPAA